MAGPPVSTTAMPVKTWPVPMVARIGVMRARAISRPLTAPATRPVARARRMPSSTGPGAMCMSDGPRVPPWAWKYRPARMPDRLAMPITDRSMPPVSMASIMAIDSRPSSGATKVMDWNT